MNQLVCIDYDQFDTLLIDLSLSSLLRNRKTWFEFHSELKLKQNSFYVDDKSNPTQLYFYFFIWNCTEKNDPILKGQ
jgi:hypothetical protein